MIARKTIDVETEVVTIADIAKALSHPVRIKILQILAQKNACICGELVDLLPLAQSTVSQHLKELKRVGLIKGEVEGPRTCYCLNMEMIRQTRNVLSELFANICKC